MKNLKVIRFSDFEKFGCPICGYDKGQEQTKGAGWIDFVCGQCQTSSFLLDEGLSKTPFGIGDPSVKLAVIHHPRMRNMKHSQKITDFEEIKKILFEFERSMAFDVNSTYTKLNESKSVETLEANFPHVINAIGKYIKEINIAPNFKISTEKEWLALVPWILMGKIDQENMPDPIKISLKQLEDWCINFKYEP